MRTPREKYFQAADGCRLFYRYWPPAVESGRALVILHRGHEHSGRLQHVVDELDLADMGMFAWDARGHGFSRDSDETSLTLGTFTRDLESFVQHVSCTHSIAIENIAVLAQSVGAVLAAAWVHDYAPRIRHGSCRARV